MYNANLCWTAFDLPCSSIELSYLELSFSPFVLGILCGLLSVRKRCFRGNIEEKKMTDNNITSLTETLLGNFCLVSNAFNVAGGKGAKSFVDRCISYIGENAIECVKTNSFLNLPKDALVKLISSDCVCSGFHTVFLLC